MHLGNYEGPKLYCGANQQHMSSYILKEKRTLFELSRCFMVSGIACSLFDWFSWNGNAHEL